MLIRDVLSRLKQFVGKVPRLPVVGTLAARYYKDMIPVGKCIIDTHAAFISGTTKADMFWGTYEGDEISFVDAYLPADSDVIELGCSLGVVSSHIAHKLEPNRRLICVDANQALIPWAERNVRINAPHADVSFIHGAIDYSETGPTVQFAIDQSQRSRVGQSGPNSVTVPRLTLSAVLQDKNIREFNLVCDIEGAEKGLLECDPQALATCRTVVIELHSPIRDGIEDLVAAFHKLSFSMKDRSGRFKRGHVCVFERQNLV